MSDQQDHERYVRDAALRMRAEAERTTDEARSQLFRIELMRTRNEQLRQRMRERYPGRFATS
jgi:hypothetical protein